MVQHLELYDVIAAPGVPALSTPSTGTTNEPGRRRWPGQPGAAGHRRRMRCWCRRPPLQQHGIQPEQRDSGTSVTTEQPVEPDDVLLGSECDERERYERLVERLEFYDDHYCARSAGAVDSVDQCGEPERDADAQPGQPVSGGAPASYAVQVSTSPTFSSTVYSQSGVTSGTSLTTGSLSNLTTYYWEVNATNANGTSAWSSIWSFTTIIAAPGSPTLSTPSTGAANQSVTPTLTWSAGSGGTPASYAVQVSTSATFSSTVYSQSGVTGGTSVTTSSLSNLTMYYWEVNATNANGTSAWSSIWSFTTIITAPGTPALSTPSTGAANEPETPTLTWAAGSGGTPASYAVQVSTSAAFSSTVYSQSGVTGGTSVTTSSLSNITTYYWEVNATNANGTSAWSSIWSFTTIITAPGAPTLSTPANNAANQSVTPTLTWAAGGGGTPASYAVQVSTSATFSSTVYSQSGVTSGTSVTTGQSVEPDDVLLGSKCDQRERHERMVGSVELYDDYYGARSADPVKPIDRSANQSVTPTLTWSAGSGGTPASYAVQVSTSATFSSTVYSQSGVTGGTSVTVSGLSNLTTYYWEVNATNANGTSAWSGVWSFTTVITAPGVPGSRLRRPEQLTSR